MIQSDEIRNCITCCLRACPCLLSSEGGALGFFCPGWGCAATIAYQWLNCCLETPPTLSTFAASPLETPPNEDRMPAIATTRITTPTTPSTVLDVRLSCLAIGQISLPPAGHEPQAMGNYSDGRRTLASLSVPQVRSCGL